jgi:predicted transcriptional regulator
LIALSVKITPWSLHSYLHSRKLTGGLQGLSDEAPTKKRKKKDLQKRTRYDIYAELLRVIYIWGFCPLTRAARSTNMPVDRAKESITQLVNRGLLEEDDDDGMRVFKVTVRGHQYLELYKRMAGLVGIPIPDPIIGM